MFDFNARVIFCEQVRREFSGQLSYIGVFSENNFEIEEDEEILPVFTVIVMFEILEAFDVSISHNVNVFKFDKEHNMEELTSEPLNFVGDDGKALNQLMMIMPINNLTVKVGDFFGVLVTAEDKIKGLDILTISKES